MHEALAGAWEVRAGVIPSQPIPEFTQQWFYLASDREIDNQTSSKPWAHARFSKIRAEAMDYFTQVSMPHLNNWAEITFIWY